jgi:hypothetical protein
LCNLPLCCGVAWSLLQPVAVVVDVVGAVDAAAVAVAVRCGLEPTFIWV